MKNTRLGLEIETLLYKLNEPLIITKPKPINFRNIIANPKHCYE